MIHFLVNDGRECNKLSTFPFCKCEFLFIIDHKSQVIAKRA